MLHITTRFFPIRMNAYIRNEVEMTVEIENRENEERWVECDISIPEAISLAADRTLTKGRIRVGIIKPGEILSKKVKIYGGASSYPDIYTIRITAYGFGRDGAIAIREEKKAELRCERISI